MNALQRLENGGFTFDLTPNGEIAYTRPDDAPARWINTRAAQLLAEIRAQQEEVMTLLRARPAWNTVWDEWTAVIRFQVPGARFQGPGKNVLYQD